MASDDVPSTPALDRRSFLKATGTGGTLAVAATAGCTDLRAADRDDVVLSPPEGYDEDVAAELPHPTYGDEVPEVTIPAPLADREVTTTDFVGERHSLYTFLFTRCSSACPGLMANLVHVQADSLEEGYADDVTLCPVTFDPEHDTPEVLAAYEEDHGVDDDAGNWYTLRPETPAAATDVVDDTFGVTFAETDDADGMAFMHTNLVLVVNEGGHVERAYTGDVPTPADVVDDVRTLLEEW
ncbi:protein SCO1/2 [Halobiforma haloterrestris]|uniref:Protein SCO1/2 n=1 Tax=Natronobacterium haloterrestre TaxID=148448 RepID=A0A1I1IJK2_NATHA|nr:SCO family protein [Halobiforma haloterrestris]SFC35862.1 protein SCO1/2 [Halobiforma haloterrestris]